ncbi:hypothetical protein QJS66_14685 [Kocuria rhizophila]|nr:hypothetical protein QJS66_14685 [Kocuria rhizophila]
MNTGQKLPVLPRGLYRLIYPLPHSLIMVPTGFPRHLALVTVNDRGSDAARAAPAEEGALSRASGDEAGGPTRRRARRPETGVAAAELGWFPDLRARYARRGGQRAASSDGAAADGPASAHLPRDAGERLVVSLPP